MISRAEIRDVVQGLIVIGKLSRAQSSASAPAVARIKASDDDAGPDDQEFWGQAPLLYRAADETEGLAFQLGDERLILGTRDLAYQVALNVGEVVLRALGNANRATLTLKPDGNVLVGANAAQFAALANLVLAELQSVKTDLDAVKSTFDAHVHTSSCTAGGATTLIPAVPIPTPHTPASVAASKVKVE